MAKQQESWLDEKPKAKKKVRIYQGEYFPGESSYVSDPKFSFLDTLDSDFFKRGKQEIPKYWQDKRLPVSTGTYPIEIVRKVIPTFTPLQNSDYLPGSYIHLLYPSEYNLKFDKEEERMRKNEEQKQIAEFLRWTLNRPITSLQALPFTIQRPVSSNVYQAIDQAVAGY